jgi:hypothetical protein
MSAGDGSKGFWFPAKRHGWGWGIGNCWQGLLVQIGYIALVAAGVKLLLIPGWRTLFWSCFVILTVALVVVHWLKGEAPRWRWGND